MTHSFSSALITGGSSGIGEALAKTLGRPGVHLTITGRNAERLAKVAAETDESGASTATSTRDVKDADAMRTLVTECEARAPLDLVVANAGVAAGGETAQDTIHEIFDVNLTGVLNTVLPAVDAMKTRGRGHIAIVSSVAGFRGLPTAPAYSASKVAVRAWGEAIRPNLESHGLTLSLIFPGFVESRITDANDFPMPWMMPAEKAAGIILRGLEGKKRTIAFPWQMVWTMRLLTALPAPIFEKILSRAPKKT